MTKILPTLVMTVTCLWLVSCDTKTKTVDSCGDGYVDPGEQCDTTVGENSCASLGYYDTQGELGCNSDCTFDTSDCGGRCGDSTIQGTNGEQCDGDNLNEQTCISLGYYGGTLACDANCQGFNEADCVTHGQCGDETIQEASGEVCDGSNLGGETCVSRGWYGGTLACAANCGSFNETGCTSTGWCGDGTIQGTSGEQCDGDNLGGATCASQGYSARGGAISCKSDCRLDIQGCIPKSSNADLASLTLTSGTLAPAFTASTTSYSASVSYSVTSLTVTAAAADAPYATVGISPVQPMTPAVGANQVVVTVTAEDGTQKTYTVVIRRMDTDYTSPNIGTLIYVPAGTFQRDATPTNLSVVSAFRMSQYEITRSQWVAVTGWADPSDPAQSSGTSDPVQGVNWYDVITFCNKLSIAEGLTPVYAVSGVNFNTLAYSQIPIVDNATWNAATVNWAANGYRLPTEMEWKWAAMGADTANPGVTNYTGRTKAFAGSNGSNLIGDYVVFGYGTSETGRTTTERSNPVGSKLANELGFHDLSGNVWEWVWDWYADTFPTGTLTDYRGPASGTMRVYPGGAWPFTSAWCGVNYRSTYGAYGRNASVGFRVVRR